MAEFRRLSRRPARLPCFPVPRAVALRTSGVTVRYLRLFVLFVFGSAGAVGQWLNYVAPGTPLSADGKPNLAAPVPRTADGKPDLSGVWMHEITSIEEVRRLFGRGFED